MKAITIIIASLFLVSCYNSFAQDAAEPTSLNNESTPVPSTAQTPLPTPIAQTQPQSPTAEELQLAPLLDLYNGGQATGVPQPTTTYPSGGTLVNGTLLPLSGLGFEREHDDSSSWGTGMMISLIMNSAAKLTETVPGNIIYVGSIAQEHGGTFPPHKSHQSGLDADILFLGTDSYDSVLDAQGNVTARFEPEKNWAYWKMIVSQQIMVNGKATSAVSMILVDPRIKTFLCAWTKGNNYDQDPFNQLMLSRLRPTAGHDGHFHLRLKCSPHYADCNQQSDYYKTTGCEDITP